MSEQSQNYTVQIEPWFCLAGTATKRFSNLTLEQAKTLCQRANAEVGMAFILAPSGEVVEAEVSNER